MNNFIFIMLLIIALILSFILGAIISPEGINKRDYPIGCWKIIEEKNRSIIIQVDNQNIEEIIDTARHEICHEIDYRIKGKNYSKGNETFAKTCNPEDYKEVK